MADASAPTSLLPLEHIQPLGLGVAAIVIALLWGLKSRKAKDTLPYPPGPPPKPFIGNVLDFPTEKETETFERWYRQYGEPIIADSLSISQIPL